MVNAQAGKFSKGVVVIAQSGGPTSSVNNSLIETTNALKENGAKTILGAVYGIDGIKDRKFYNLHAQSEEALNKVAQTPGMALGSKRQEPTPEDCEKIVETFRELDVRYFFFIGGDNTARSTMLISNYAHGKNYELHAFHVPKTIDNDILITDHTPGFGTAARYVARAVLGIEMDNRSLPGVHIVVTMGKDAGFIAASAAAIEKVDDASGPHKVYIPEKEFSITKFLTDVENTVVKYNRGIFVVSEGIWMTDGKGRTPLVKHLKSSLGCDGFGGITLSGTGAIGDYLVKTVQEKLGVKRVRQDTFGYSQRSFVGNVSKVDVEEAKIVGRAAVQYVLEGYERGSVALNSLDGRAKGSKDTQLAMLDIVGNGKKTMDVRFFSEEGNGITEECTKYIAQLMGGKPWAGILEPLYWEPK